MGGSRRQSPENENRRRRGCGAFTVTIQPERPGHVFSYTNDMAGNPWERPVTSSIHATWLRQLRLVTQNGRLSPILWNTSPRYRQPVSTQLRTLTCSRDQGAACRRCPCGWRPKYRYGVAPRKAGSRQGAQETCGRGCGGGRDQNLYNRVWMCEDHSITTLG